MVKKFKQGLGFNAKLGIIWLVFLGVIVVTGILIASIPRLSLDIISRFMTNGLRIGPSLWRILVFAVFFIMAFLIALIGTIYNLINRSARGVKPLRIIFEIILLSLVLVLTLIAVKVLLFLSFSLINTNLILIIYTFVIWTLQSFLTVVTFGWYHFKKNNLERNK